MKRKREEGAYEPTELQKVSLCFETEWDHKAEDEYLSNKNFEAEKPSFKPKIWRRVRPSEETLKKWESGGQNNDVWEKARKEGTGSSNEFAEMCGLGFPYGDNVTRFKVDSGVFLISRGETWEKERGHYCEPVLTNVGKTIMGYEAKTPSIKLHPKLPHKHSSPDLELNYPEGVCHNLFAREDPPEGVGELKNKVYGIPRCTHKEGNLRCQRRIVGGFTFKVQLSHLLQTQDQMEVYLENKNRWNDYQNFWRANSKQGPVDLGDGKFLVGEFVAVRIYYNADLIDWAYKRFHAHVAAVRKAQATKNFTPPKRLDYPTKILKNGEEIKIKMVLLKEARFIQDELGHVSCEIDSFWEMKPIEVTLSQLKDW
jgi:hypothetical protein